MSNKNKKKNNTPSQGNIFLNREEAVVISMGLAIMLEDMQAVNKGEKALYPWTPEARKDAKDIYAAARSAANKLEKYAGIQCTLPEYKPGDEQEFFTKES